MKKKYRTPKAVNMPEEAHAILTAVMLSIPRALMKAPKGYVDLLAGADTPKTLQARR